MFWQTSRSVIDLGAPRIMGIVNITPDSFSDGGRYAVARSALHHCEKLLVDGADILDLGAESSRPGTPPVSQEDELKRLLPVLGEAVKLGVPVSVDTYKPEVMQQALDLGADIINDIWALRQPGACEVVAAHPACGVCLMHMHGEPQTMQQALIEGDAVPQVRAFLLETSRVLEALGVRSERIVWDSGIGFGKSVAQNFSLLARQCELLDAGYPLLAGWSRKSSLGTVTGLPVHQRVVPSVAAALLAAERGARILRVHDVKETVAALKVWNATISGAKQAVGGNLS
jgi:dihydropteroate synthase